MEIWDRLRKLNPIDAEKIHVYNKSLNARDEDYLRYHVDDRFGKDQGMYYHYVEANDRFFEIEYKINPETGKIQFTGNAWEIEDPAGPDYPDFDDDQ